MGFLAGGGLGVPWAQLGPATGSAVLISPGDPLSAGIMWGVSYGIHKWGLRTADAKKRHARSLAQQLYFTNVFGPSVKSHDEAVGLGPGLEEGGTYGVQPNRTPYTERRASSWLPAVQPWQGANMSGGLQGMQGARPVHVTPPFLADPLQANALARLPHFLGNAPGGTLSPQQCMAAGGFVPGLQGLGATYATDAGRRAPTYPGGAAEPPPVLFGDPIPGARSREEALYQESLAKGTTVDAQAAYMEAIERGASHDQAVDYAAPVAKGVAQGASEGILGGIASIIGSILGPVAGAGSSVYATYEQSRLAKEAAKQRDRELMILQETRRRDQEFALLSQQGREAFWAQHGQKVAIGAVGAAAALGLAAWAFSGGKKKGRRR